MTDAPKHASRPPRVPFALLVVAMLIGGLALLLGLNTLSAANELSRNGLVDKDAVIAAQVEDLRNEVAASAAPANIEAVALALGMVHAQHPAFLMVGADGIARVMGKPKPVQGIPLVVPTPASTSPHATPKATPTKATAHSSKSPGHSSKTLAKSKSKSPSKSSSKSPSKSSSKSPPKGTPSTSAGRPKAKPTPTPTPTPVVTYPGGTR